MEPTNTQEARLEDEPMGIVISRGSRAEASPAFTAYVWSADPEPEEPPAELRQAVLSREPIPEPQP